MARRCICGGAPAGPGRPERRVPELLRLSQGRAERAEDQAAPACGARLDRDINAAVNVARAAGLAVTACRAQVRPGARPRRSAVKQEPSEVPYDAARQESPAFRPERKSTSVSTRVTTSGRPPNDALDLAVREG